MKCRFAPNVRFRRDTCTKVVNRTRCRSLFEGRTRKPRQKYTDTLHCGRCVATPFSAQHVVRLDKKDSQVLFLRVFSTVNFRLSVLFSFPRPFPVKKIVRVNG
ncbi:hypothetical protein TGME49_231994 [Toxoplasma gondii ME49]|uniref:Uncharacterized protein n=2 Tax=Toxoplasma gondii TaxID=5811 RepID=A0A125YXL9_TOXGV|nr:hypothetical protein TGME49_231994 [Toxoplasma gondii ME49]EPT28900.1 hypothetical protein TGME49_231994 [Toxoplasma gondii ME49]ESS35779.1 hypothetical protein TGVEG_231994 [Toxoplasma gondii VEG]|eukprot:XP_018636830.1 hypothetical protein TGME49_231994 [Toxoplasma gondii ME49]